MSRTCAERVRDHDHHDSEERIKQHWDEFECIRYEIEATERPIRESEQFERTSDMRVSSEQREPHVELGT